MVNMQFESKVEVTEYLYDKEIKGKLQKEGNKKVIIPITLYILISVAMLFWSYTVGLGIFLLLIAGFIFATLKIIKSKKWMQFFIRDNYRRLILLHAPLYYGFDDNGFSVHGKYFSAHSAWYLMGSYNQNKKWIRVFIPGIITHYYSIAELKEQGVYKAFVDTLDLNAKQNADQKSRTK